MLSCAEKAVALNTSDNASAQYNLGQILRVSYDHHHTLAFIDRAILAMGSAVPYSKPHYRMKMLTELAEAYYRRLYHVRDTSDASVCIECLDQAMKCGKMSFRSHAVLIDCLHIIFSSDNDVQCYERALSTCETLLADDSLSNTERGNAHVVFGATLLLSCEKGALSPVPRQLEKCVQTLEHGIKCISPGESKYRAGAFQFLSKALALRLQIGNATVSEFEYAISIGRRQPNFSPTKMLISRQIV